jgi:hypothetical protein
MALYRLVNHQSAFVNFLFAKNEYPNKLEAFERYPQE